jgi:hypothetical protein
MSQKDSQPSTGRNMQISTTRRGVTFVSHERELHMFQLTEDEIDNLQSAGNYKTIDIALFALCFGVLTTAIAALVTVNSMSTQTFAGFIVTAIVMALGSIFFGVRAILAAKAARNKINLLKRG